MRNMKIKLDECRMMMMVMVLLVLPLPLLASRNAACNMLIAIGTIGRKSKGYRTGSVV